MEERNEKLRQVIELAISCGRKRKSPQTGYIHYCHGLHDNEPHLPIPLVENFLYALALLRSRLMENVNEAKAILEGLLHFQNRNDGEIANGNFPIYVHEYPVCKDRFTGLHVANAILVILKMFSQVLGQELKSGLEKALLLAVDQAIKTYKEKSAPYVVAVKVACVAVGTGRLMGDQALENYGMALLEDLRDRDEASWYNPETLGEIAVALSSVYPRLGESPWSKFWQHLEMTWYPKTGSYVGPALKEWQHGSEPQVTLYDLYMGYLSEDFSARALRDHVVQLEGALILPSDDIFHKMTAPVQYEGNLNGAKWYLYVGGNFAMSCIDKGALEINPIFEKGFHPLRVVWGGSEGVHTFVCQSGNSKAIRFTPLDLGLEIDFELSPLVDFEDREKCREVQFFLDANDQMVFLVNGHKSSTFLLGEQLTVGSGGLTLLLTFELIDGEGKFVGHRMLGNRPAQIGVKGATRFNAHDWQIFMRTVNRSEPSRFRVKLQIEQEK